MQLTFQLLYRGVYTIVTITPSLIGYSSAVKEKIRPWPANISLGTTLFAVRTDCLHLTATVMWDNRPVQLLATGGNRVMETCAACI